MGDLVRRRLGTVVVLAVLLVLFSANRVAVVVTDYWWFQARDYTEVFTTVLGSRLLLGVVFGLALALLIAGNLAVARRVRPFFVPSSPQQAQIQRYREMADPFLPWLIGAVAVVFGLTSGLAVSANWESFLLWRNSVEVGITDPTFGVDVGFYLFELPFWSFVQTWLFTAFVLTLLLSAGAHYLLGGIRPEAEEKLMPAARIHLAVLLAALLAVRGWGYWLDRYALNYSPRGTVTGASYTDVNAELPALYLLLGASVVAIVLVLMAIRRAGFLLPGAAIGLLIVASIILQGAYPAAIQRLQVDPQELSREEPFIAHNLEATTTAYGLADVERRPFSIDNDLDEADVIENEVTLRNIRLWDPSVLETTYQQLQALRPFYQFNTVSVDRYVIDGEMRQVMISTRELSQLQEGTDTWQNRHITFTHGYGVVASQVNTANQEGQPVFLSSNIPPAGEDRIVPDEQPGIYFGEFNQPTYSLVRTAERELDFEDPDTQEQVFTEYDGGGGVAIGGFMRRVAYALRFADYNLVLTGLIENDSRIIYHRSVTERVAQIAPFLKLDSHPYPVVSDDGRVQWIIDAYTTSEAYPYSQRSVLELGGRQVPVNYVRNSVKAVVDAFDGTVTLYRVEEDDPILDAWEQAFPGLITPVEEAENGIAANFRYPQDLFRLQAELFRVYHIQDVDAFYNRADAWSIPLDPAAAANETGGQDLAGALRRPLEPYYLLMRLPGETEEEFVLIQPYLAQGRQNMVSWLAGRGDGDNLNELFSVRFPSNQLVLGPAQAQARIEQDDLISEYITLRQRAGTQVIRGNLQVLPIANSILYVEPLFLQADQAQIPELARVALVLGERTAFDRTFAGALGQLLGIDVPDSIVDAEEGPISVEDPTGDADTPVDPDQTPAEDEDPDPGPQAGTSRELLEQALAAFARAEVALRDGDLGVYQREIARAQSLLEQAAELEGIGVEDLGADEGVDGDTATDDDA
ncbi:UPF0182 family protein [Nitriliruptor alkaliphilus]|uniref:UPF0182 family membrane protein n=1 Tax=Nitriliruptor alkaliphilus TaxID=427918 RepID=UPI000698BF36|nr:UPF0182 family protein [Nitriliruptor alkaliphilus]